jgi:hypothetical protein
VTFGNLYVSNTSETGRARVGPHGLGRRSGSTIAEPHPPDLRLKVAAKADSQGYRAVGILNVPLPPGLVEILQGTVSQACEDTAKEASISFLAVEGKRLLQKRREGFLLRIETPVTQSLLCTLML